MHICNPNVTLAMVIAYNGVSLWTVHSSQHYCAFLRLQLSLAHSKGVIMQCHRLLYFILSQCFYMLPSMLCLCLASLYSLQISLVACRPFKLPLLCTLLVLPSCFTLLLLA